MAAFPTKKDGTDAIIGKNKKEDGDELDEKFWCLTDQQDESRLK